MCVLKTSFMTGSLSFPTEHKFCPAASTSNWSFHLQWRRGWILFSRTALGSVLGRKASLLLSRTTKKTQYPGHSEDTASRLELSLTGLSVFNGTEKQSSQWLPAAQNGWPGDNQLPAPGCKPGHHIPSLPTKWPCSRFSVLFCFNFL